MAGLEARVTAHEGGGAAAVAGAAGALRVAWEAHCADFLSVHLAEGAASALALDGEQPLAVRILSAVDTWRAGTPRAVPEQHEVEGLPTRTRTELGEEAVTSAYASGALLGIGEVIALAESYAKAALGATTVPESPFRRS
ncbi:hypothetical protein [Streptomyces lateritius]|uniref:hypothetical protein n=1 Tax=Streptomyces lateritius TaxID=67313 RepID=UPI0016766F5F|nr:hypothetical protein [Streptomyces lateritius]GGT66866.1 hypothetical protein GCM10010272_06780 [Streptomyces lateritius]